MVSIIVRIFNESAPAVIDPGKEVGLKVNAEDAVSSPECRTKSRHEDSKLTL
jgi:hypothetical protein